MNPDLCTSDFIEAQVNDVNILCLLYVINKAF